MKTELPKTTDFGAIPVSKKIASEKNFILKCRSDAPDYGLSKGNLLLFEYRDPKPGEISILAYGDHQYKMGVYKVDRDNGRKALVSLINWDILVVFSSDENYITGAFVKNLGSPE